MGVCNGFAKPNGKGIRQPTAAYSTRRHDQHIAVQTQRSLRRVERPNQHPAVAQALDSLLGANCALIPIPASIIS
jgi:hypothetical protein